MGVGEVKHLRQQVRYLRLVRQEQNHTVKLTRQPAGSYVHEVPIGWGVCCSLTCGRRRCWPILLVRWGCTPYGHGAVHGADVISPSLVEMPSWI